jgi:hypothetical protein
MADNELSSTLVLGCESKIKWDSTEAKMKVSCIHGERMEDVAGSTLRRRIETDILKKKQIL